jgi:uncharacterized membrane protein YhaH (DUF805 family)
VSRRLTALYPFLFAAAFVLSKADQNPGYYTLDDLLLVLAAVLAGLGLVYAATALVLRRRHQSGVPSLITFIAVLCLFVFPAVAQHGGMLSRVALALACLSASAALVWGAVRRPAWLRTAATFLTLTSALLVVRSAGGIAADQVRGHRSVTRSALVRDLARPIPGPTSVPGPRRNVYVILLDEYANGSVLRDGLGFDNSRFLDSLRTLGFYVPAATVSNYAHTVLSLPSLLNAAHLDRVAGELPPGETDATLVNYLMGQSRVARYLQARGYRYVFFPSSWWGSTRTSPIADSVVHVWSGLELGRELSSTEFRRVIRKLAPFDLLHSDSPTDAEFVRRTLDGVGRLPSIEGPVFAFAHVLSPHTPYVFDRECHLPSGSVNGPNRRTAYLGQIECLNGLVLATVNRLLRDSKVPPVIVLQGDHGSAMLGFREAARVEQVTATAAWERFGAFGAYYLPDGGAAAFGDTVSVVNVLGDVLRHYFGAELPREPDERYLSVEPAPFRFVHVNPTWVAGGHPVRRALSGK